MILGSQWYSYKEILLYHHSISRMRQRLLELYVLSRYSCCPVCAADRESSLKTHFTLLLLTAVADSIRVVVLTQTRPGLDGI